MTNYLQQQAFLRKIIYLGVILGLFASARLWHVFAMEKQAVSLEMREQDRGHQDLGEAALSLMLFSGRGAAVLALNLKINEYQERNQLSELDMAVSTLTKLQAHHIEPWLYHSWNLSYNVAGQCDRLEDKYYFISRGMKVLARGEQRNQNQPNLRFAMGHYYQHKICESDERNVMRSLFQLSCIPFKERDPRRFKKQGPDGRWVVDMQEFKEFCEKHPILVRRLREPPMRQRRPSDVFICREPEDVIAFLEENEKIPSFHVKNDPFPVLPPERIPPHPQSLYDSSEYTAKSLLDDNCDGYMAARAWYCYAQEPLPNPGVQSWFEYVRQGGRNDAMLPGQSVEINDRDRRVQRLPKITTVIFRTYPALSQGMLADRLEEEGWFDDTWKITGWFRDDNGQDQPLELPGPRDGIGKAWDKAHDRWTEIGRANGLLLTKEELADLEPKAAAFRKRPDAERSSQQKGEEYLAHNYLGASERYRSLTNFSHHYIHSRIESEEVEVAARKHFYEAKRLVFDARPDSALREYEKPGALPAYKNLWKKYLKEFPELASDDSTQDDAAEIQYGYMKLLHESLEGGILYRQALAIHDCLAEAMTGQPSLPAWLSLARLPSSRARSLPPPEIKGPFDEVDDTGQPLIPPNVWNSVRTRKGENLGKPTPPPAADTPKPPKPQK